MPEVVDILIDAENSGAVKGITDVDEALLKAGSAAEMAEKGVNPLAARMDALSKANSAAAGSSQELTVSWRQQVAAADAAGGKVAGLNQQLKLLKQGKEQAHALTSEIDRIATSALKAGAAIAGIGLALLTGFAKSSLQLAAEREAVVEGLKAIMGNADLATRHLKYLEAAAALPGVNLDGAIKFSVGLQGAEISADMATRAVKALGNEIALMGKGEQEFDQAQRALAQIAGAAKLTAEDLNQLRDAGLPVGKILRDAFGTVQIEQIQALGLTGKEAFERLIGAMEKAPDAVSGLKNVLDNLKIGWDQIQIKFGEGLKSGNLQREGEQLNENFGRLQQAAFEAGKSLAPMIEKVVELAVKLTENDGEMLKSILHTAEWVGGLLLLVGAVGKTAAVVNEVTTVVKLFSTATEAAQVSSTAMMGSLALLGAAIVAVGWFLVETTKRFKEMKAAQDEARESAEAYNDSLNKAQGAGYVSAEDAAKMKAPAQAPGALDVIAPWKTRKEREWDAYLAGTNEAVGKAAPGRSVREQQVAGQRRAAAEAQAKGGASAPASRAPKPTAGAAGGPTIVAMPAQRPTADGYGWVARPEVSSRRRELATALDERDRKQQEALLDAIRGRR